MLSGVARSVRNVLGLLTCFLISFQLLNAQSTFKFDFGNGKTAPGYTAVTTGSKFDLQTGYGFDNTDQLESIDRGGNPLTGDFITSKKPFYFSVRLPEGNYDVKLWLGDTNGNSATTVRTECRRLMLENTRTTKGKISIQSFTVHVRDTFIRDEKGKKIGLVRIKPRERAFLHWDNLLTIEFNDSLPKVAAMEITPNQKAVTVFLAGNSTVVDQDKEPWAAWGQIFPRYFEPGKICIANYAESGEALRSFYNAKRLDKILSLIKKGDYLFIEFAHNDQKEKGEGVGAYTTYTQSLQLYIREVRKKGGIPILITSMHRRNFDGEGKVVNTLGDYPDAMRKVAKEEKVGLIDLNAMSKILYETWGPETSMKAFVHYAANTFARQTEALKDNTHFNPYGATELAKCIVSAIKKQQLPLAKFIRKDIPAYTPLKPLPFEKFYWPLSLSISNAKPDGN
jgi:lysophospholipase L1-like esterase